MYEYYKELPEKEFPDTLEEMEPLFRAVYHGCAAGEPTRIWEQVYWGRINRGNDYFIWAQLGAFGSWLGAVGCFFDKIWSKPAAKLTDARKALVLSQAGFCLRAVGRLREAAEPFKTSLGSRVKDEKWKFTAIDAGNLSELYLTLGEVEKAVEYGSRCVEYADKSRDEFSRMGLRTTVADALHRVGDVEEAKRLFEEAEGMQKERQPEYPHLYSLQGYRYCVLLLAQGKTEEVKERVKQTLEWVTEQGWLLDMALDKVSLGRAELYSASRDIDKAEKWLNEAVDGLRNAGTRDHLPRGLLARAELYRKTREFEKAEADLEEAREIAERGEMKLFLADYHLEAGRLCAAQQNMEGLKGHYEKAAELVKECGYHRRDKEVEELRRIVESG